MDIESLQRKLREFAATRDWEQYHNPKNLSMALAVEASELQEIFQWMTVEESEAVRNEPQHAAEEIADVFIYLARLADVLGIDLEDAVESKIASNGEKYPARGSDTPRQ
jgi:NTP pyrophosphatase (non-canonical NTP hydrolase)